MASSGMYLWIQDISASGKAPLLPKLVSLMRLPTNGSHSHVSCTTISKTHLAKSHKWLNNQSTEFHNLVRMFCNRNQKLTKRGRAKPHKWLSNHSTVLHNLVRNS